MLVGAVDDLGNVVAGPVEVPGDAAVGLPVPEVAGLDQAVVGPKDGLSEVAELSLLGLRRQRKRL